jgi:hypothetical protein
MKTLSERILAHAAELPEGTPLGAKELLHLGKRAALDQALSRLVRRGKLMRASRGIYVRPVQTKYGVRAPAAEKVVERIAHVRGETVAAHGAAVANALGLTTQVPTRLVFSTSGPSRRLKLGAQHVEMKHAPQWQLAEPEEVGKALRALVWLGEERAPAGLALLKKKLSPSTLQEIADRRLALPGWLARSVSKSMAAGA